MQLVTLREIPSRMSMSALITSAEGVRWCAMCCGTRIELAVFLTDRKRHRYACLPTRTHDPLHERTLLGDRAEGGQIVVIGARRRFCGANSLKGSGHLSHEESTLRAILHLGQRAAQHTCVVYDATRQRPVRRPRANITIGGSVDGGDAGGFVGGSGSGGSGDNGTRSGLSMAVPPSLAWRGVTAGADDCVRCPSCLRRHFGACIGAPLLPVHKDCSQNRLLCSRSVFECPNTGMLFTHPTLAPFELAALYSSGGKHTERQGGGARSIEQARFLEFHLSRSKRLHAWRVAAGTRASVVEIGGTPHEGRLLGSLHGAVTPHTASTRRFVMYAPDAAAADPWGGPGHSHGHGHGRSHGHSHSTSEISRPRGDGGSGSGGGTSGGGDAGDERGGDERGNPRGESSNESVVVLRKNAMNVSISIRVVRALFNPLAHLATYGPIDLLLSSHVLEHIPDLCEFMSGVHTAMRAGGVVFSETPAQPPLRSLQRSRGWKGGFFHVSYPSERGWLLMMEAIGFQLVTIETAVSPTGSALVIRSIFMKPMEVRGERSS